MSTYHVPGTVVRHPGHNGIGIVRDSRWDHDLGYTSGVRWDDGSRSRAFCDVLTPAEHGPRIPASVMLDKIIAIFHEPAPSPYVFHPDIIRIAEILGIA